MEIPMLLLSFTAPLWLLGFAVYAFLRVERWQGQQIERSAFWRIVLWLVGFVWLIVIPGFLGVAADGHKVPINEKLVYTLTSYLLIAVMYTRARSNRRAIVGWYLYACILLSMCVGAMWFWN